MTLTEAERKFGVSCDTLKKYLDLTERPDTVEEQIRMLQRQRRSLLDDIHRKQHLLDCLDFIIRGKKKS